MQGFLRVPFHFADADMYTISAHKLHGPKGVGALAVKKGVRLNPQHIGGGQEEDLRLRHGEHPPASPVFARPCGRWTPSGLMEKKLHMVRAFMDAVPEAIINGPAPEKGAPHILNISFPGVRGETMLHALEAEGVYALHRLGLFVEKAQGLQRTHGHGHPRGPRRERPALQPFAAHHP